MRCLANEQNIFRMTTERGSCASEAARVKKLVAVLAIRINARR